MATLGRSPGAAPLTSADIPDGSVTAAKIATDTIVAGDVAPNAITASELADDAVDTNAILNDAVTNAKIGASAVGTTEMAASVIGVKPHIIPDVLYPAWSGLIDNHTGFTFTDSSTSARAIISSGIVHHSGSQEKVGSTSMKFGLGSNLGMADHADWETEEADFTIEFWVYFTQGSTYHTIWSYGYTASGGLLLQTDNHATTPKMRIFSDGNSAMVETSVASLNTWYHYAILRTGTTYKIYRNGVETFSGSCSGHDIDGAHNEDASIGATTGQSYPTYGYIDDFRFTKGLAIYTGAFTPQTTALTTTWSGGTNIAANATASNVKLLIHSDNGGHVGAYGTAQSDSRKYYYTDIKGSKPIKDPRIGAHFGSQRHKTKSLQLLEQETAIHGENVYSIDGREWARAVGNTQEVVNNLNGLYMMIDQNHTTHFYEFVCYCSSLNMNLENFTSNRHAEVSIDGGAEASFDTAESSVNSPLKSRFVDAGSLFSVVTGQTLGIHTIKIRTEDGSDRVQIYGIEPIAQDTSNVNHIQIPSQNVVSYGKKFTVADTLHYNPFALKTDGSAWTSSNYNSSAAWPTGTQAAQHNIDTATSLGLAAWVSTNYYYPYNGGRVVVWVASDGTIKTSVNMMPPNARNIGPTASNEKGDDSAGTTSAAVANTQYLPTFTDQAIDHSQAEIAKTFIWREIGNGAANGGGHTGAGTYADASMLVGVDDIGYVMDDGLTSLLGDDVQPDTPTALAPSGSGDGWYFTFIGTGISYDHPTNGIRQVAQNLPYGTHILKVFYDGAIDMVLDGVVIDSSTGNGWEVMDFNIYQPKKPPIPENAVVLADYMLMADYVKATAGGGAYVSKGTRLVSVSRDMFHDTSGGAFDNPALEPAVSAAPQGFNITVTPNQSAGVIKSKLAGFGTHTEVRCYSDSGTGRGHIHVDDVAMNGTDTGTAYTGLITQDTASTLGVHTFESRNRGTSNHNIQGMSIVTPIHTSSHYQTFETPYLHELVGGDRNMEQTNLVVTPDGKTWDEVTRDTSYIGTCVLSLDCDGGEVDYSDPVRFDECRGYNTDAENINHFNKDFAIAYDRYICLKNGEYFIHVGCVLKPANSYQNLVFVKINGDSIFKAEGTANDPAGAVTPGSIDCVVQLKRGDYVQVFGGMWTNAEDWQNFHIERLSK